MVLWCLPLEGTRANYSEFWTEESLGIDILGTAALHQKFYINPHVHPCPHPSLPIMHLMDVDTVNILNLNSVKDSTITNINLYSLQAQITRLFKFDVVAGQNKVVISGLPNVLDHDSLRYEGYYAYQRLYFTCFRVL